MYLFSMRKLLKRLVKWGTIGVVAVVALGLLIHLPLNWMAKRSVERQLEVLRGKGIPTSPEELMAYLDGGPERPDITALIWEQGEVLADLEDEAYAASSEILPISGSLCVPPGGTMSEETLLAMRTFLNKAKPSLDILAPMLDQQPVVHDIDWVDPMGWANPDMISIPMRTLVRTISVFILESSHRGDYETAGQWLSRGYEATFAMRNDSGLINGMAVSSLETLISIAFDDAIKRGELPEDHLRHLQRRLIAASDTSLLRDSLYGEIQKYRHQAALWRFEWNAVRADIKFMETVGERQFGWRDWLKIFSEAPEAARDVFGGGVSWNEAFVLEANGKLIDATALGWPELTDAWRNAEEWIKGDSRFERFQVSISLGVNLTVLNHFERHAAGTALTATACGVELYIAEHGAPPESLDALSESHLPAGLNDPHTGRPFLYERLPDGYTLRSEHARECGETGETEDETCRNACSLSDLILTVQRPGLGLE